MRVNVLSTDHVINLFDYLSISNMLTVTHITFVCSCIFTHLIYLFIYINLSKSRLPPHRSGLILRSVVDLNKRVIFLPLADSSYLRSAASELNQRGSRLM